MAAGRLEAAAQVYRKLEREAPGDVRAAYSLAVIDIRQGRLPRARERLAAVVEREPALAAAHHNLGAVSQQLGAWPEAARAYEQALALRPEAAETRQALAVALAVLGRGAEAIAQHRALAADPAQRWPALTRIALIDPAAVGDGELAQMQEASGDASLPADVRAGLLFALGDVLERRASSHEAFEAYAAGNRLQRAILAGRSPPQAAAAANAAAVRHVQALFTPAFVAGLKRAGRTEAPIFVVGMPRSGSTLIEQILASHPQAQGLGETAALPRLLASGYPRTPAGFRELGAGYLAALRERGWDGAARPVDKTLENYLHVGAIRLAFPRAVILHATRDPVDTGFACYRQLFTQGNETLYDLADIGAEYQRYRAAMAHWAEILPGAVVEVGYEALVGDPDAQIRSLVTGAAGLGWDPACLRFFERQGAVATASASQVRRPIFRDGVQRWRRHAAALAPLIEALGPYAPAGRDSVEGRIEGRWRE